jgi:hypothetical protein
MSDSVSQTYAGNNAEHAYDDSEQGKEASEAAGFYGRYGHFQVIAEHRSNSLPFFSI